MIGALIEAARRSEGRAGGTTTPTAGRRARFPPGDPDALEALVPAGLPERLGATTRYASGRSRADGDGRRGADVAR